MFYRYLGAWMCAVTYLFEMEVSKTWPHWTPRQLGEWDSFLLEHLHHQHICLVWEACLLGGVCGCVRGCVAWQRCVWVCERVWEDVSGAKARGTGAKSIHTHRPSQLDNITYMQVNYIAAHSQVRTAICGYKNLFQKHKVSFYLNHPHIMYNYAVAYLRLFAGSVDSALQVLMQCITGFNAVHYGFKCMRAI